jgi:hypothetical protein
VRYANLAHKVRVTDGHEAEARRAESHRPLNRLQRFFLRVLGMRGDVAPPTDHERPAAPSHEHPVPREHTALAEYESERGLSGRDPSSSA